MRINRNIAANYASRLWAGISTFIFVPAYLRILGPEPFGLVTFSAAILGIVFVLDMGMSNAFAREVSRQTDTHTLADLLRSLEWIYLAIIVVVLVAAILFSGTIAEHWLNADRLAPERVRLSVALMLLSAILQVMMALYIGGLLGSNRHVTAAAYQIGFGLARSGIVLIPLYFFPVVELVFAWQLAASIICLLMLRRTIWRMIDPPAPARFSQSALQGVRGFAGGMFGIALIAAINTQSDKIVVSKLFSLEQLGFYSIASLIGQIPSMLALPLAVTVLPRLTGHVARHERQELVTLYMRYSLMIGVTSLTAAIGVIVGAPQILELVQGSAPVPEQVLVTRILAAGGALLAMQYMPYHLAVACGHTRTNLALGAVAAITLPVAMFVGASHMGMLGAAIPWLAMNAIAALYLAWRITPRFLGPHLIEWTWKANLLPLLIGVIVIFPASVLLPEAPSAFAALAVLALFCSAAVAMNGLLFMHLLRGRNDRNHGIEI